MVFDIEGNYCSGRHTRMKQQHCKLFLVSALVLLSAGSVLAQDTKLLATAKKEGGKVVVYGSLENDTMDLISAAFQKKTGLDVYYGREAAKKVRDGVAAEFRAGKPQADVVLTTTSTLRLIQKD